MPDEAAPRPWACQWSATMSANGQGHVYIVDAAGRKIAAIWGKSDEKLATAELIVAAVNGGRDRRVRPAVKDSVGDLQDGSGRRIVK